MPLASLPPGSKARVVGVLGGHGAMRRILDLGLVPGTIIEVVAVTRGPVVIRVRGALVAVGRGLAEKVLVEPL